ncbi:MAG TPA: hypothetical protein VFU41_14075 [Gemmatimonadales bacterium]|nr:hypothetical protein [Gemmatimonadales bacterium]
MKRLALVLALVAMGACKKAEQQPADQSGQMAQDTSQMMMSDTAKMMMGDTSKQMAPAPAKRP